MKTLHTILSCACIICLAICSAAFACDETESSGDLSEFQPTSIANATIYLVDGRIIHTSALYQVKSSQHNYTDLQSASMDGKVFNVDITILKSIERVDNDTYIIENREGQFFTVDYGVYDFFFRNSRIYYIARNPVTDDSVIFYVDAECIQRLEWD